MKKLLLIVSIMALTACVGAKELTFIDVYDTYRDFPTEVQVGLTETGRVWLDSCPPEPDGVCAAIMIVEKQDDSTFYVEVSGGALPGAFYGPFTGDAGAIGAEATGLETIKEPPMDDTAQ